MLGAGLLAAQLVYAAPPVANFTISDSTPNTNQSVTFTSTSTDPDNDIATYEWDFDYDGNFTVDATGSNAAHTYSTAGSRSVALRVTDTVGDAGGDGTVDSALSVKTVTVSVPNQPPNATNITFTPAPPQNGNVAHVGQTIAMSGAGNDPDGDPITYEWAFGDGGTATGQNVTHAYGSRGAKTVTLTVRDNHGETDTHQESVTVNALPVAEAYILNAQAESGQRIDVPLAGQNYALTSGAVPAALGASGSPGSSDAEGALSGFAWDLDNNGSFETSGANVPSTPPLQTAGQKTVGLRVTDSNGATDDDTLTYRVNSAPQASFIFDPATPVVGKPVQFSSTSSDPDGPTIDPLTYTWDLDGDGTFGESTGGINENGANPTFTFASAGTKTVRLRVKDTGGITREVSRQLLVQLTVPDGSFDFSPNAPLPGQAVGFTSTSSPSAGKQLTAVEWDFDYDQASGTFTPDASGASVSHAFPTAGNKLVAMRVSEGPNGGFDIVTRTVSVNAPPRAGLALSDSDIFVGDTVTISSTSSDPDGPLVNQEWDLDGDGAYDDAKAAVVSATYRRRGSFPVALRVTDSKGATSTATGTVRVRRRPLLPLAGVQVGIKGRLSGKDTVVTQLRVRAPKGAKITVRCAGRDCPKAHAKRSKGRRLRFPKLERKFGPGVRIIVTVSRSGFLGRRTTFTTKSAREPARKDLCIAPGAKRAKRCPSA